MTKRIISISCFSLLFLAGIIPLTAFGASFELLDDPWVGFSDNTVIDYVIHNNNIWCITGNGLSFTEDGGLNWQYYDESNGLFSTDIASIYSDGTRLWLGLVTPGNPEAGNYLAFTDDDGFTWDTLLIDTAYRFTNPIFDITGADSLLFFTSKVGGLYGSFDYGATWRNIYYSRGDSVFKNYVAQYTNHYFSAVVDTFHNDSIVVWGGSADGLMRYIFAPDSARLNSDNISDVVATGNFISVCGDSGLTFMNFVNSQENFISVKSGQLPGTAISTAFFANDRLFIGTLDGLNGDGSGLAISDDTGLTFHTTYNGLDNLIGANKYPVDFISVGDVIFMAGFEDGLYKTIDSGDSWTRVTLDADPASGLNKVHSLDLDSVYLWVGTDSGLVKLTLDLDNDAAVVDETNIIIINTPTTGGRAAKVKVHKFYGEDDIYDSTAIWAILHPIDTAIDDYGLYYSLDFGINWKTDATKKGWKMYDIESTDSMLYIVGHDFLTWLDKRGIWWHFPGNTISDSTDQSLANFENIDINAIEIVNDTIYLASQNGLAVSPAGSFGWKIFLSDLDPQHFSSARRYTFADSLTGNWANAMAIQPSGQKLWASTHPGGDSLRGNNGISTISLDGGTVEKKYIGSLVWNFAFDNQDIFAASDAGLLYSTDDGATWDTLDIRGVVANSENREPFNLNSLPVYGVMVENNNLWIGTDEGAGKIDLAFLGTANWEIYRDTVPGTYAYPVPFSPYGIGGGDNGSGSDSRFLKFSYNVPADAYVTIEVYDFAMNLVKTVTNSQFRTAGAHRVRDRWNGRNHFGEIAAVGMYYFKISLSTGEIYWGKLAIMP